MIVGPFTGEPGYETLYWLPFLRKHGALHFRAVTRGGAGIWYGGETEDAYELIGHDEYRRLFDQRYMLTKVQKSFGRHDVLDSAILRALRYDGALIHPADMYQTLQDAENWPFAPLPKPERHPGVSAGPYIAAAFYTSHQLQPGNAHVISGILTRLADKGNRIVALRPARRIDDHGSIPVPAHDGIEVIHYEPEDSLRVQSQVIAHAEALVCTYGGLSYLGPHYGVPTRAFHCAQPNEIHKAREDQMAEQLGASYQRIRI